MQSYAAGALILVTTCLLVAPDVRAANILAVFTFIGKSHWISLKPLLLELASRGHRLTVLTPFPEKDPPQNWENIAVKEHWLNRGGGHNPITKPLIYPAWRIHGLIMQFGLQSCEALFQEEAVHNLIITKERKFDLLIMEYFIHNCFLAFAHKFQIPVIGMASFGGFVWMSNMMGNPNPYSYVPDALSDYTDHMDFSERLMNTVAGLYQTFLYQYYYVPNADSIIAKFFNDPSMPSISEIGHNTSLLILLSHTSFSYPRPNQPNVIEVGGMHIKAPKKLPQDLQKFLDESPNGVLYFSMGSYVKSTHFPEEMRHAFLSVFSKLKERVLWKWENDTIEAQPSNVKLGKWLPQLDILAHKNVKLFITHGGLQSTLEAMDNGVPLLAIPIAADQRLNAKKAERAGFCIKLDVANITAQSLEWAISELLTNPQYKEKAKLQAALFKDRPQKPLDTALYWTEYVIRHKGAHHLRNASLDLAWYQYFLLDVITVLLVGILTVMLLAYLITRTIIRLFIGSKSVRSSLKGSKGKRKPKTQ